VVDHDTGRLVWAAEGHDRNTLQKFFDLLGTERANNIKLVSADAAEWIGDCAVANCVNAELCLDPFHIVRWVTNALDVGGVAGNVRFSPGSPAVMLSQGPDGYSIGGGSGGVGGGMTPTLGRGRRRRSPLLAERGRR